MGTKKSRLIRSLADLQKAMGSASTRKSIYILRNDRESEYAIVVAHGADKALDILLKHDVNWHGLLGKGVSVTCAQHGVDDDPQLIWFGFYGKKGDVEDERDAGVARQRLAESGEDVEP